MYVINKITGQNVTSAFLDYMMKKITKDEFEKIAGIKEEDKK